MPNKLFGKTVILTGSSVVKSAIQLIEQHGGRAVHFPLIKIAETVSSADYARLQRIVGYDWLIFTSQNAVESFLAKCTRHKYEVPVTIKIAAVGEKTAQLLNKAGLTVHFMPTIYSADVFVREFQLAPGERALFLRGSMAKSTIREGTGADEWTVYETQPCLEHITALDGCIVSSKEPIVVFASPSAVDVYAAEIASNIDWHYVKVASIGHITTAALQKYGVTPYIQPTIYTIQAVIEQLILEEH
ncbi:MAG: uroporphyrinogen-III synthase [Lysinibacillus sp.]